MKVIPWNGLAAAEFELQAQRSWQHEGDPVEGARRYGMTA
jgi:hypothetical protein